jgi:hypothetical protein
VFSLELGELVRQLVCGAFFTPTPLAPQPGRLVRRSLRHMLLPCETGVLQQRRPLFYRDDDPTDSAIRGYPGLGTPLTSCKELPEPMN